MKALKFTFAWFLVFAVTYTALSAFRLVPVEVDEFNYRTWQSIRGLFISQSSTASATEAEVVLAENETSTALKESVLPSRISIPKISVDFAVINPMSRDIAMLDNALRDGVVRFPGSGGLDDTTNMFLFGHSTTFNTVRNEAYKALNNLEKLTLNDEIVLVAGQTKYRYMVTSVRNVDKDDALVEFAAVGEKQLTLSTCDTFGGNAKEGRIVVEARFVGTSAL